MRWKERAFLSRPTRVTRELTIAGFYYVCLDRRTGLIEGLYADPKSMPYQQLLLRPARAAGGCAFSDVRFS